LPFYTVLFVDCYNYNQEIALVTVINGVFALLCYTLLISIDSTNGPLSWSVLFQNKCTSGCTGCWLGAGWRDDPSYNALRPSIDSARNSLNAILLEEQQ
jgi:hypothetical protein